MQFDWEQHAGAALIDLEAALSQAKQAGDNNHEILGHLGDSRKNLDLAIEAMEEQL